MKLLKDVCLYCIKIDYFMINEKDEEYTEPNYLSIDTETKRKDGTSANILIFNEKITDNLRVFDTEEEAKEYMETRISNPCYGENQRVVKITYNTKTKEWEEC